MRVVGLISRSYIFVLFICYVALTGAQEKLYLSSYEYQYEKSSTQSASSSYIGEMGEANMDMLRNPVGTMSTYNGNNILPKAMPQFAPFQRVTMDGWGDGTIIEVDELNQKYRIVFDKKPHAATLIDLSKMDNAMARMIMETINNMLIELYAAMAQAEIEKKEKRQREGLEAKKARGEWDDYGRPAVMSIEAFAKEYAKVVSGELRPFQLMQQLGMSKATFYRYAKSIKRNDK